MTVTVIKMEVLFTGFLVQLMFYCQLLTMQVKTHSIVFHIVLMLKVEPCYTFRLFILGVTLTEINYRVHGWVISICQI